MRRAALRGRRVLAMRPAEVDRVLERLQADELFGYCLACGNEAAPVEPDARGYRCAYCGELKVYGAELLLLSGRLFEEDAPGSGYVVGYGGPGERGGKVQP